MADSLAINSTVGGSLVDWLAMSVALIALGLTFYQYWRTEFSPFSLVVLPPALTQANDDLPSLIMDISISNTGGRRVVLSDVAIRLLAKGEPTGVVLYAQKSLVREAPYSALPLDKSETKASVFLPILLLRNDSTILRLYFAPFADALPMNEASILATNAIAIDFSVDGVKKDGVFVLSYPDYREKFRGGGVFEIPENGFAPRWYRDRSPAVIKGS